MSRTRQWYYDGATIPGATGKTVVVGAGQLNAALWECRTQVDYGADSVAALAGIGGASAFSPLSLFASGEEGGWYDPSDLSTLYQDSTGTTPVTAAGQTVGLVLDKSQGLTLGAENIADPTLTDQTGWSLSGDWVSISGGFEKTDTTANSNAAYALPSPAVVGKTYLIEVTINTPSVLVVYFGTSQSNGTVTFTGVGTFTRYLRVVGSLGGNNTVIFRIVSAGTGSISNASVRELPGNHLAQADAAKRPAYQTSGGLHWLDFDGEDDGLVSPTITPGVDKAQAFVGVAKSSDTTSAILLETSVNSNDNSGSLFMMAPPTNGGATYSAGSRGASFIRGATSPGTFAAPTTNMLTALCDNAADSNILRIDGAQEAQNLLELGASNFLAYPLYVGRRGGTSLPFDGNIYGIVLRFGANLDADTIAATETYIAEKTGVTL